MSELFVAQVQHTAEPMANVNAHRTGEDAQQAAIGRVFACQFIEAIQIGNSVPHMLLCAIALLGRPDNEHQLMGFLAEIEDCIVEAQP